MENKFDLIEAYIENRLPEAEKHAFENELKSDTELQKEVSLQKDIINALQEVRKAELKARLSNLPTPSGLTSLQKFGIAAVTLSAGALLTLGLLDASKLENTNLTVTSPQPTQEVVIEKTKVEETIVVEDKALETIVVEEATTANEQQSTSKKVRKTSTDKNTSNNQQLSSPSPGMFELEDASSLEHHSTTSPKNGLGSKEKSDAPSYNTTIEHSNKKFMYKYDGENLTLIGDFSTKPYTVIESPSHKTAELYLSFDGKYYEIRESKKAVDLVPIQNAALLKELSKK